MVEAIFEVKIPKPLLEFGIDQIQVQQRVVEWLVFSLFTQGQVSSGQAARLLNISRIDFLALLRQHGIAYIDYSDSELLEEFQEANNVKTHNTYKPTSRNPYIVDRPIGELDNFFGRDKIISNILQAVFNNQVAITGPRRSGKSSLLMQLRSYIENMSDEQIYFCPIFFDLQSINQNEFFDKLMHILLRTLKTNYFDLVFPKLIYVSNEPNESKDYNNYDFEDDLHEILMALGQKIHREIKFILLVDEGDKINEFDLTMQGKIRGLLSLNKCLKMIWAGVNILAMANHPTSPWYNMQISFLLPPLDNAESRRLILEPARKLGYTYHPEALESILSYAKGQPYIIQYVCYHAVEEMLKEQRSSAEITLTDVEIAIAALAQELASQDKNNVVYQNIQEQQDES